MNKESATAAIKAKAIELGFSGINIAKAAFMTEEAKHLEQWLNAGYHGGMNYMENHFDMRVDPTLLVPGAKSVICLLFNYYTDKVQEDATAPKLSMYAYGKDYHKVVKKKLKELYAYIRLIAGDVHGRCFVDSAPIMERDWAKRAGLGWTGKNTLLINPKKGSYFFLAEIICDLELLYDSPMKDYCGTCTRCIEACPTDAIAKDGYILDSSKCISYLTIELKDEIPKVFEDHMDNWMYGCDICQKVCPWNRFSSTHTEQSFEPSDTLMTMTKKDWEEVSEASFNILFEGSAVKRTKFEGLKKNLNFLNHKS
jgi:epoxyqueuosine reductase